MTITPEDIRRLREQLAVDGAAPCEYATACAALLSALEESRAEVERLESDRDNADAAWKTARDSVLRAHDALDAAGLPKLSIQERLAALTAERDRLKGERDNLNAHVTDLIEQRDRIASERARLKDEGDHLASRSTELVEHIVGLRAALAEMTAARDELASLCEAWIPASDFGMPSERARIAELKAVGRKERNDADR